MSRDFTLTKYEELCDVILRSGYVTISVKDYLLMQPKEKTVIPGHLAEHSSARLDKYKAFGCLAKTKFLRDRRNRRFRQVM